MRSLFLHDDLTGFYKSESSKKDTKGGQRGGKYVARVQVGYDKDGSAKYRYFRSGDEYKAYLEGRKGKKATQEAHAKHSAKRLEEKTKKEHEESTQKQESKKMADLAKSVPLYLGVDNVT